MLKDLMNRLRTGRELNHGIKEGRKIERIQQSCYLAHDESARDFLVKLGVKHGFNVKAFKVEVEWVEEYGLTE